MPTKRRILEELTREWLLEFAKAADVTGVSAKPKAEIVDVLAANKRARLREFLPSLSRDELKAICAANNLDDSGREKQLLIDRLLGEAKADDSMPDDDQPPMVPPAAPAQVAVAAMLSAGSFHSVGSVGASPDVRPGKKRSKMHFWLAFSPFQGYFSDKRTPLRFLAVSRSDRRDWPRKMRFDALSVGIRA